MNRGDRHLQRTGLEKGDRHRTGNVPSQSPFPSESMAIPQEFRHDHDAFDRTGGAVFLKMNVGIAAEVAGDQLGDRLSGDQTNRFIFMAANQWLERIFDAKHGEFDIFALRRADGQRGIEPLAEDPQMSALQFVDLEALP